MPWNYRILAREYEHPINKNTEVIFEIYSVYYNKDGVPDSCSAEPAKLNSENETDLKTLMQQIKDAFAKPILWYGDGKFPQEYKKPTAACEHKNFVYRDMAMMNQCLDCEKWL